MFDHLTNPTLLDQMIADYNEYKSKYHMWINKDLLWEKWIREL